MREQMQPIVSAMEANISPEDMIEFKSTTAAAITETASLAAKAAVDSIPIPGPIKDPIKDYADYAVYAIALLLGLGKGKDIYAKVKNSPPGKLMA